MVSRRDFLGKTAVVTAALATTASSRAASASKISTPDPRETQIISLCGPWKFRLDAQNTGTRDSWFATDHDSLGWVEINVPHTWQIDPAQADYRGIAWYRRDFDLMEAWRDAAVRIEFEAVFHSATVWVNGHLVGEHSLKGYTAFTLDITSVLQWAESNTLAIRVDNSFNDQMLPRGRSSDWANDGGIFRPVQLLVTPKTFIERIEINAVPDVDTGDAALAVAAYIKNTSSKPWNGTISFRVVDDNTGLTVSAKPELISLSIKAGASHTSTLKTSLIKPKLWHFDSPHLYRLESSISNGNEAHKLQTAFGVRKFGTKDGQLHLNGEPVRLTGVERMAGSNPEFGMAEPAAWIEHEHSDMKHLNCIFTRVHWPQDHRVLDYCDRNGILMQCEVPAWGSDTFQGMGAEPDPAIMENGLEQLREMIARDRNHPSVVVWGLCNEIGGQTPPAFQFAKRMLQEAKQLDPDRLCSYASNSLSSTPERDVAGLMDFIETNEYFGTWQAGTAQDASKYLDELHSAFPGKPIVVSEYGYCACAEDRPEGDEHRIDILRTHAAAIRSKSYVGGAIFFCYNDYRTHVGDRGVGVLQQRVHGVVNVYGAQKPSYRILREESSPIASLSIDNELNKFHAYLQSRKDLPTYTLRGYVLHAVFYGQGNIPVELQKVHIPELVPGGKVELAFAFARDEVPVRVQFHVLRPMGFSAYSVEWVP